MSTAGERVELGRYELHCGERVIFGQRVDGAVAVVDVLARDHGRVHLVERHLRLSARASRSSPTACARLGDHAALGHEQQHAPETPAGVATNASANAHAAPTGADTTERPTASSRA